MLTPGLCTDLCMGECTPCTPRRGKVKEREGNHHARSSKPASSGQPVVTTDQCGDCGVPLGWAGM